MCIWDGQRTDIEVAMLKMVHTPVRTNAKKDIAAICAAIHGLPVNILFKDEGNLEGTLT